MTKSLVFTTLWLIGFPMIMILVISQFVFSVNSSNIKITRNSHNGQTSLANINNKAHALNCSEDKVNKVKALADRFSGLTDTIDCNLNLSSNDIITKRLIFPGKRASGVTVNCNGATINGGLGSFNHRYEKTTYMLEITSVPLVEGETWEKAENITIKNCNIKGSVRISIGSMHKRETKKIDYVHKIRKYAPSNIVLDNITVTGMTQNMVYFGAGVTYSELINSELKGSTDGVPLYLDAESQKNTIKGNVFNIGSHNREVMSIDGSSENIIMNNWFSGINKGGIFLYRNCGEKGRVRHSTPSHNLIVNNVFYYKNYRGSEPAIYLGSRNGDHWGCDDDKYPSFPYGSSISDLDYAKYNVIMQNRIFKVSNLPIGVQRIKTNNPNVNGPNYIAYNDYVTSAPNRLAGCYVPNGYEKDFILNGESIELFATNNGIPACKDYKYTCNDGELIGSENSNCTVTTKNFECQVSGNNKGCQETIRCPAGQKIIGAAAACNLENGTITGQMLANVSINNINVFKESDHVLDGLCWVGRNKIKLSQKKMNGVIGMKSIDYGCKEHDENGGDCHIKGTIYCH